MADRSAARARSDRRGCRGSIAETEPPARTRGQRARPPGAAPPASPRTTHRRRNDPAPSRPVHPGERPGDVLLVTGKDVHGELPIHDESGEAPTLTAHAGQQRRGLAGEGGHGRCSEPGATSLRCLWRRWSPQQRVAAWSCGRVRGRWPRSEDSERAATATSDREERGSGSSRGRRRVAFAYAHRRAPCLRRAGGPH